MVDCIYIKDCGNYITLSNINGNYENHAHIIITNPNSKAKRYEAFGKANVLKKCIEKQQVPKGKFFRNCALRITINEKYKSTIKNKIEKDKQKLIYYNVNKGVKK